MENNDILFDIKCMLAMSLIWCIPHIQEINSEEVNNSNNKETIKEEQNNIEFIDTIKYVNKIKISNKGKEFIKSKETLSLKAYQIEGEKHKTIGWGHYMMNNENYSYISKSKADKLFNEDIENVEKSIERILDDFDPRFKYTQGFIDGLGSLIFNCGESGVKTTEFYNRMCRSRYDKKRRNINYNDLCFSIAAIKNDKVFFKGHISRRYDEHKMMLN